MPCVSIRDSLYPYVENGTIKNRDITPDDLHPNDEGHSLVAGIIIEFLEKVYASRNEEEEATVLENVPVTLNRYENSVRYQNYNSSPVLEGFVADKEEQNGITDNFKRGFYASKVGDAITFEVEGTNVSIQYRKSIHKPAPVAEVQIDDGEPVVLDANFEETWGDSLHIDNVAEGLPYGKHKVRIAITEAEQELGSDFYLVSVIGSGYDKK